MITNTKQARAAGFVPLTYNYAPSEEVMLRAAVRQLGDKPHIVLPAPSGGKVIYVPAAFNKGLR